MYFIRDAIMPDHYRSTAKAFAIPKSKCYTIDTTTINQSDNIHHLRLPAHLQTKWISRKNSLHGDALQRVVDDVVFPLLPANKRTNNAYHLSTYSSLHQSGNCRSGYSRHFGFNNVYGGSIFLLYALCAPLLPSILDERWSNVCATSQGEQGWTGGELYEVVDAGLCIFCTFLLWSCSSFVIKVWHQSQLHAKPSAESGGHGFGPKLSIAINSVLFSSFLLCAVPCNCC
mmetsp:Transcript_14894/g.24408  ORF Transcript_14894/g.24408 Transcript_14894/m.24408 type:complete len:229 (-) Transcript_14894:179-865(-)